MAPDPAQPEDLDFYVRKGQPVALDDQGGNLLFDFLAAAVSKDPEIVVLECLELEPGMKLYVLVANRNAKPAVYTLQATPAAQPCSGGGPRFLRGDPNADGRRNIADADLRPDVPLQQRAAHLSACSRLERRRARQHRRCALPPGAPLQRRRSVARALHRVRRPRSDDEPNPPDNIGCASFACP